MRFLPFRLLMPLAVSGAVGCTAAPEPASSTVCRDCEITLQPAGWFSDASDPGSLPYFMLYPTRLADGGMAILAESREQIFVYDSTGALRKRLGRQGAGPGEFGRLRRIFRGPGDSLFATDWFNKRLTVFTPSLEFARAQDVEHPPSFALADGRYIVSDQIETPDLVGWPVHVLDRDGKIERSFGVDVPAYRFNLHLLTHRLVTPAKNGDVWTIAKGRYVLERWDPSTGERRDSIPYPSTWFKETARLDGDETKPPANVIETLWEDEAGLVWVLFRVADLEWKMSPDAGKERVMGAEEYERTYDWVIEVVDPSTREVVAQRRFRETLWGRPPGGLLVSARATSDTASANAPSVYDVWRPTLTPRGSR